MIPLYPKDELCVRKKSLGIYKNFGIQFRSLKKEGGGCVCTLSRTEDGWWMLFDNPYNDGCISTPKS